METNTLYNYLERINALLRVEARRGGSKYNLQPVHLEVLHYLSICNRYSDTPMAVTDYLAQTKGTVSQTIKVLESKGLLVKSPDSKDKRVTHLKLSAKGRILLRKSIPSELFSGACSRLDNESVVDIILSLQELLHKMQEMNDMNSFGVCRTCKFNQIDDGYFCGLTKEKLSAEDAELICREHQYPAA